MNVVPEVTDNGDGSYSAEGFLLHMEGHWQLIVGLEGGSQQMVFDLNCCE